MSISYGRQWIEDDDVKAVKEVLHSSSLTQGEYIPAFENALAQYTGAKYAVAVSNGTAALHIAYMALGLKNNNEIITSPMTFAATSNAALYCKAKPVFTDIIENTGLIDDSKIENAITEKTKIITPIHYAGLTCNMEDIKKTADKYNLYIVEDACHAIGSKYKDSKTGSCDFSNIAVFSFHPVKHITTGEGGAILTNNENIYNICLKLRSHGMERQDFINTPDSPAYHEMQDLGYNYRMTDLQAALGISQLAKLDKFVKRRREIAEIYANELKNISDITLQACTDNNSFHSYHLFPILLKDTDCRDKLYHKLREKGIYTQIHYMPVNKHPYYEKLGYSYKDTPKAYDFYRRELSIPMYPKLTDNEVSFVIECIKNILSK